MLYSEFNVGSEFNCSRKRWLCTDKGTRVIIAVCLTVCRTNDWARSLPEDIQDKAWEGEEQPRVEASWLKGPPYALAEHVFDENDQKGCEPA